MSDHDGHQRGRVGGLDPGLDPAVLRAQLNRAGRASTAALDRTEDYLASGDGAHVAWSGGKDSTVAADLANRVRPGIPVVHYDCGLDFPETTEFLDRTAAEWHWDLHRVSVGDGLGAMVGNGSWDHAAPHGENLWWWVTIEGPATEARRRFGDRMIWGLRAEESARRLKTLAPTRGVRHRADGSWTLAPCWDWRSRDIWAYHADRSLPVNPLYARLEALGVPEAGRRVSGAVGSDGAQFGRLHWLRRGWPDLWQRYCAVLPRLREKG